ncbi:MAG: DUF6722 family protein [Bacteroidia bacterium]
MTKEETRNEIGKYLLDISKLVFGGVVLASVIQIEDVSRIGILSIGVIVTLAFALAGFRFFNIKNKK